MKVALLTDCYLPRLGGIEVQVHDLAVRLRQRGHDVHVFTAAPGPNGERHGVIDRLDGVPVHRLALRLPFELPVNPLAPPELGRRLRRGGFDVAHVHTGVVSPFATDAARVAHRLRLPTVMTWHCMLGVSEPAFRLLPRLRRWAREGVAMTAVSQVAAASVQRVLGDAGEVTVLPNGIDVDRWAPEVREGTHPRAGIPPAGEVRLVSAMRLAARKRPIPLLHIVRRVRQLVPESVPLRLDVLGEGPQRARTERYAERHGMAAWVHLPGRVTRAELHQRYAAADLYLAPGLMESFGIAALEARTAGLPVVGRHQSGISEFVEPGVGGLLAPDDEAMAAQAAQLVTDPDLRARFRRHNSTVPPAQSWPHVLDLAEGEYERAIAHPAVRRGTVRR
ncbi:MAG TPA: glycosyltransferase [Segeticoccus sp.]|uniref:glycosyltransferase n=1 Tax=Segeticoccus sp. TaxID=2706531 RepID=UPI002D7F543E|nr:glycosyltransferase [Segeticoccus sp.]HET8601937.1 glycosyltransferase [Segeticoccus sp.]